MPASCSAYNCKIRKVPGCKLSFYRFPFKNEELLARWVIAMKVDNWQPTKHSVLCQEHFEEKCFRYTNDRRILVTNAVPTIFDFPKHMLKKETLARPPPKVRTPIEPIQPKPQPKKFTKALIRYTLTKDHTYAYTCPSKVKKLLNDKREECVKIHKQLRLTQLRMKKVLDKCASLRKTIRYLRLETYEKDELIECLLSSIHPD